MGFVFVCEDSPDREYLLSPGDTLETDLGILEVPDSVAAGDTVETHLGTAFSVRELRLPDLFDHFERTGAPMMPRDVGLVLGHTGIAAGDRVLDAGTGTGVLAAAMGRVGAEVVSYERDQEFAEVARENISLAGVDDRVTVRTGDVTTEIKSHDRLDAVTLDTGDAPAVVAPAADRLVAGGFLVAYSPFVEASRTVAERAREAGLTVTTYETIQRNMEFGDRGTRPATAGVGHTGYLTFART